MNGVIAIYRREFSAYFQTPLAWVFLSVFAFAAPSFAWRLGRMFDTARADLAPFFDFIPWLLLILMPALAMRAWAEERDQGTLESLLVSPISVRSIALGKFLAAWTVSGFALIATFPIWIAMNILGDPDNAAIFSAYLGALMLAGGYLSIGQALSALTTNQVIAFVLGVVCCLLITITGVPFVLDALSHTFSGMAAEAIAELSALARFEALRRGIIAFSDLVYFLSLIGLGLGLTVILIDAQRRLTPTRWRFLAVMSLGFITAFTGLNMLVQTQFSGLRTDLTERQLYRLSDGSRDIISGIDEPILLHFYFSRAEASRYPAVRAYGSRVRSLLRTLADQSAGRIILKEIDPAPFSEAEDQAITAGLQPLPAEGGGQIFFGLLGQNTVDEDYVIAFFDPLNEPQLEFEIIQAIVTLERTSIPQIGILTSLPFEPDYDGYSTNPIIQDLLNQFDVTWLDRDFAKLDTHLEALLVIHPPTLTESQLYLIDQFLMKQGRLLVLVDPMSHLALKPSSDGLPPIDAQRASNLGALLASWGVSYDPNTVVMDTETGLPVQIVEDGRVRTRAYPLWFNVPKTSLANDLPAVSRLELGVNLGSPGLVEYSGQDTGLTYQAILQTGALAARLDADFAASSPSPETLMREVDPAEDTPLTMALKISGQFQTAFPNGTPIAGEQINPNPHLVQSQNHSEVIIIADSDILDPAFFLSQDPTLGSQTLADNANLILNLTDWLAGNRALISLRSRSESSRPMILVDELRAKAEAKYLTLQDQLRAELSTAEQRLFELTQSGRASTLGGSNSIDNQEVNKLRTEILSARARLREVEVGFRADIDALEVKLIIWTVWMPPLGILMIGLTYALLRRRQVS